SLPLLPETDEPAHRPSNWTKPNHRDRAQGVAGARRAVAEPFFGSPTADASRPRQSARVKVTHGDGDRVANAQDINGHVTARARVIAELAPSTFTPTLDGMVFQQGAGGVGALRDRNCRSTQPLNGARRCARVVESPALEFFALTRDRTNVRAACSKPAGARGYTRHADRRRRVFEGAEVSAAVVPSPAPEGTISLHGATKIRTLPGDGSCTNDALHLYRVWAARVGHPGTELAPIIGPPTPNGPSTGQRAGVGVATGDGDRSICPINRTRQRAVESGRAVGIAPAHDRAVSEHGARERRKGRTLSAGIPSTARADGHRSIDLAHSYRDPRVRFRAVAQLTVIVTAT